MFHPTLQAVARAAAATFVLGLVGCQSLPTLESIKYGYSPSRADVQPAPPKADDYNDVAAGWAPERQVAGAGGAQPAAYGWDGMQVGAGTHDGSPVGAAAPGAITQTHHPMNDGIAVDGNGAAAGSRDTILEKYLAVVEELDILRPRNEDLQLALEMSEMRANDLTKQLKALQVAYDDLGASKQGADSQNFELAARLATAQIARLEAERALLEATLEWRRMSAANNQPLGARRKGPAASSGSFQPASGGARRK